jgi:hypothetical protein
VELAQLQLDLHLPGTGHAEEQKIRSILPTFRIPLLIFMNI